MKTRGLLRAACLTALVLALVLCGARAQAIDLGQIGSIALVRCDGEGKPLAGREYWLYRVGAAVSGGEGVQFVLSEEFGGSGAALDDPSASHLAQQLAGYVQEHPELSRKEATADAQGRAAFEGLECGLYLVMQAPTDAQDAYERMTPFVVTLPMHGEAGEGWAYEVLARPKASPTGTPAPEQTPEPSQPPKEPSLPQTGLARWPIPVLAGSGLVLFALGWVLCFAGKRHE